MSCGTYQKITGQVDGDQLRGFRNHLPRKEGAYSKESMTGPSHRGFVSSTMKSVVIDRKPAHAIPTLIPAIHEHNHPSSQTPVCPEASCRRVYLGRIVGHDLNHCCLGLPVPFSFNKNIYHGKQLLKMSLVPNPEQVIYAVYGRFNFTEADGSSYAPMPTNGTIPANKIFYLSDKNAIAAFLDGHVESISPPFSDRAYGDLVPATS
jgi:prepilin-type processing-associated H-X9-DG protein